MSTQHRKTSTSRRQSPRHRAAALKNLQKAWQANRSHWEFTPARRRASQRTIQQAHAANRKPGRPVSAAQREAARRNVAKARKALEARGRSPEHLARLRQSIAKARAARTDKSIERQAQKVLSHGLFARRLRAHTLVTILLEDDDSHRRSWRLIGATERLLRRFLRLRFGRDPNFHTNQHRSNPFAGLSRAERQELTGDIEATDGVELFDELDEKWL